MKVFTCVEASLFSLWVPSGFSGFDMSIRYIFSLGALVTTTLVGGRAGVGRARIRASCKLELLPDLVVVASLLRGRVRTQRAGAGSLSELDFPLE